MVLLKGCSTTVQCSAVLTCPDEVLTKVRGHSLRVKSCITLQRKKWSFQGRPPACPRTPWARGASPGPIGPRQGGGNEYHGLEGVREEIQRGMRRERADEEERRAEGRRSSKRGVGGTVVGAQWEKQRRLGK